MSPLIMLNIRIKGTHFQKLKFNSLSILWTHMIHGVGVNEAVMVFLWSFLSM